MLRRKRITILVIVIVSIVLLALLGILGVYLYKTTDMFKPSDVLFQKYLAQNIKILDEIKFEDTSGINSQMQTNKYTSDLTGTVEYTENIQTSDENKSNPINSQNLEVKSDVDKANNYLYRNISLTKGNEKLTGLEYLQHNKIYAVRVNGIQQFVSSNNFNDLKELGIDNMELLNINIDFNKTISFSDEEKDEIEQSIMKIIKENVSTDKYHKNKNITIQQNNKSVYADSYYIEMTYEEYNNLLVKILESLKDDQVVLSKLETLENTIQDIYPSYNKEIKENFVNDIEEKIKNIQDNNIGSDKVKITVYENSMKTIRTTIEKTNDTITLESYNSTIVYNRTQMGNESAKKEIRYSKNGEDNISFELQNTENDKVVKKLAINYLQTVNESKAKKNIELEIANEKYQGKFNIEDNIEFVNEFENSLSLDEDNVSINELDDDQKKYVKDTVNGVVQQQSTNANIQNYNDMLEKLDIINGNKIETPTEGQVSEIEKKRFNSQFEFFASENLTSENISDLMQAVTKNIKDVKFKLNDGSLEDLDTEKMNSNKDKGNYIKTISGMVIYIKSDSTNDEKTEQINQVMEELKNGKFNVSLEYDDNGLVKNVIIDVAEKK